MTQDFQLDSRRFWGKYMAYCQDIHDPKMLGRIRVECPAVTGSGPTNWTNWALPCFPPGHFFLPKEGDRVWVEFVDGDPQYPVWVGMVYPAKDSSWPAGPYQDVHYEMKDKYSGQSVDIDKQDHQRDKEHLVEKNHKHPPYYDPHAQGIRVPCGHGLIFEGAAKGTFVTLEDKWGRFISLADVKDDEGIILSDKKDQYIFLHDDPLEQQKDDHITIYGLKGHTIKLDSKDKDEHIIIKDSKGQYVKLRSKDGDEYIEIKGKAGHTITINSIGGKEKIEIKDKLGQYVLINSANLSEYIELKDRLGDTIKLDGSIGSIRWEDKHGNILKSTSKGFFMLTAQDIDITANNIVMTAANNITEKAILGTHKTEGKTITHN